ncbi:hypothetical protein ZHAS_00004712 [Anopheles sinensis]|uniref:Ion_trans_2 domain-containing protein n=1 Tax=Anopheles sinensis TaxID=74873 RepID=A0A084VHN0_ANOSI|nr:hypothetical protein ZHAS_00004712 [Anopheles sinensis]
MEANKTAGQAGAGAGAGAVPVVARRRRRVARQLRESTPDPARDGSVGSRSNSCDDQSGSDETRGTGRSTVESSPSSSKKSLIERAIEYGSAHRNKILARKDKKLTIVAPRSRSVPRDETEVPSSPEIFSLLRRAKRSLSTARKPKTDDSSDGGRISDTEVRQRRERIERFRSERAGEGGTEGKPAGPLQANLQRFNEERRRFELEKLKFLQEKRELDRMRLRRFEKYREEMLEEQSRKLQAKLQQERARSIEATPMPPLAPSAAHRSHTPTRADTLSPPTTKKKILIVPKAPHRTSSHSASSSEDEGRLSSDEEKKAQLTVRRRFSPRKPPKRPRSTKLEPMKPIPAPDTGITSPESELPSDFQPEEPEAATKPNQEVQEKADKEPEMVLTHRRVAGKEHEDKIEEKNEVMEQSISTAKEIELKGEELPVETIDSKDATAIVKDGKGKLRRRPLVPYVEKPGEVFGWGEIGKEMVDLWRDFLDDHPEDIVRMRVQVNHCLFYFGVMVLLCGVGGIVFRLTEGTFESQYKCGVRRVKREFIDHLWLSSHNQREEDWKLSARNRLRKFEEELQVAFEAGMKSYSGNTAWNFINGVIYSLTEVMKGLNVVYDMVRRPSADNELQGATTTTATTIPQQTAPPAPSQTYRTQAESQPTAATGGGIETVPVPETPTTPIPETFEIDDEFNLPISVAIVILVGYMLFGATIYCTWENWSFFEAFYFVFISISTIGFGDYVPQHPIYMMCSILYLIFGLALTSMCINVVQLKLSDSFRQASAKIGATIGLQMAEAEMASQHHSPVQTPIEMAGVHTSTPTSAANVSLNGTVSSTPALPARPSSSVSKPEKKE